MTVEHHQGHGGPRDAVYHVVLQNTGKATESVEVEVRLPGGADLQDSYYYQANVITN